MEDSSLDDFLSSETDGDETDAEESGGGESDRDESDVEDRDGGESDAADAVETDEANSGGPGDETDGDGIESNETDDNKTGRDEGASGSTSDGRSREPATTTYQWTPDGTTCASCGGTVERRWHGGDGLVCVECKEW